MIEVAGLRKAYAGRTVLDGVDLVVRPGRARRAPRAERRRQDDDGRDRRGLPRPRTAGTVARARRGSATRRAGAAGAGRADAPGRRRARAARDAARPGPAVCRVPRRRAGGRRADRAGRARAGRRRRASGGSPAASGSGSSLAIALAGDPEVLILDEPTAGMDPEARRATRELVAGLRRRGADDPADDPRPRRRRAARRSRRDPRTAAGSSPTTPPDALVTAADAGGPVPRSTPPPRRRPRSSGCARGCGRAAHRRRRALRRAADRRGDATFEIEPAPRPRTWSSRSRSWAAREGLLVVELRAGAASLEERYLELTGDRDVEAARERRARTRAPRARLRRCGRSPRSRRWSCGSRRGAARTCSSRSSSRSPSCCSSRDVDRAAGHRRPARSDFLLPGSIALAIIAAAS